MSAERPSFAENHATHRYYERRVDEYDEWYPGEGLFAGRDQPGWHEALGRLRAVLMGLHPASTLDVACGTAFLSRHLGGRVLGFDRSAAMAGIARGRIHAAAVADALSLPRVLNDGSRHRVFKRYLSAAQLADEIGGSVIFEGNWFVAGRAALNHFS